MSYIGQIELTKKKPPKVEADTRAWSDLYDTLNHLIDSVNSKNTTEQRRPGDLHNSIGDLTIYKDKTDNKYYMESMTEDGSARREMFISDKDNRTGDGYYSVSSAASGGGSSGSADSRNIEQQLFEQIPWTGGTPNNIAIDADGNFVKDKVVGATVSNSNIIESNLVGSGKTWGAGLKPKHAAIDNDGNLVLDDVVGATVTNNKIVASDVVGSGKTFTTKPPVTFKQDGIPTSLTVGDLWYDTNDGNKLYIAESVGADAVTGGEWVATVDGTIATAQSTANTAETNAQTGITNAASAQSTANSALSTANGKNVSFYQDAVPTSVASGDMWFDTDDEYKMYRANAASVSSIVTSGNGWYVVNAVPTLNAIAINASQITAGYIAVGRINAASIAAATISATQISAGTIDAARIATSSLTAATIDADSINLGTASISGVLAASHVTACAITSGTIDIGSGSASIASDGATKLGNGRFHFYSDGDMYIKPLEADSTGSTKRGIIFTEPLDGSGNWSDYHMLYHDEDTNEFRILYNGSDRVTIDPGGDVTATGDFITEDDITWDSDGVATTLSYRDAAGTTNDGPTLNGGVALRAFMPYWSTDDVAGYSLGTASYRWQKLWTHDAADETSDLRLKRNIETVPLGLDFINSLNPVQYNRYVQDDLVPDGKVLEDKHWGLIAQEVRTAMEEAGVSESIAWHHEEDIDRYSLAYTELIAPMIKAIQELKAEVDLLKA